MRNRMQLRWIEQREARDVLATMRFEEVREASWCAAAREAASDWLARAGAWFAAQNPASWQALQAQPALVRSRQAYRRARDDDDYSCRW